MPSNKKLLQAAAGNAGESLYVEDVFSTFLYAGNGAYQTITNGIDLLNEGGLVWGKSRTTSGRDNYLWDTERGYSGSSNFTGNTFSTNTTTAEQSGEHVRNIYEDGYQSWGGYHINMSGQDYVSWTFRKAKKFFDIVTWTGDGSTKTHNHNLGSTPAAIIVKRTDSTSPWSMYHKDATDTVRSGEDLMLYLNTTAAAAYLGSTLWAATDSTFTTTGGGNFNASGGTYVAYLFASDAGGFGDDGTENIIKCGSYTGNASTDGPEINLGFEPQWVYAKRTDSGGTHGILDVMRGMPVGGTDGDLILFPNTSDAEINQINLAPTPTGFKLEDDGTFLNQSGATYIYIAIRRPMKTPESGTEVFDTILRTGTGSNATITGMGFTPDLAITKIRTIDYPQWAARLTNNKFLKSSTSDAEATGDLQSNAWDVQEGLNVVTGGFNSNGDSFANWFFRRATGFMDVVAYKGSSSVYQKPHNLGVVPELMIVKNRTAAETGWSVYTSITGADNRLQLNSTGNSSATSDWDNASDVGVAPTATHFNVKAGSAIVNNASHNYIAYLFATLDGVSKVGSYTGTGSDLNVDCGFSAGARFILIKRYDSSSEWYVWDSERGIVAGNDPYLLINSSAAEVTNTDYIDPLSSGFTVTSQHPDLNASGGTYIFLAIA